MTFDVAVVGAPFLDLTFEGLPRVPLVGEEVCARALHVGPGGTGMQAIGVARLGLTATLLAPLRNAGWGALLRRVLESEGVTIGGGEGGRSTDPDAMAHAGVAITALLSTPEGVAMASVIGDSQPQAHDVANASARAVVLSIRNLQLAPTGAASYAVTGGLELPRIDHADLERLGSARAFILNTSEAMALTNRATARAAAHDLARHVSTVVVTTGADGAVGVNGGDECHAEAPRVEAMDTTGAGDLFVSAYVWADLHGASFADRLAWSCLYASLSVRAPTALAGATDLSSLLVEGRSRGLTLPPLLKEA